MKSLLRTPTALIAISALSAGCATSGHVELEPLSIEFGQGQYLTDDYLAGASGSRCGAPLSAPGGVDVSAALPDGTWFRVFAVGESPRALDTVVLERGVSAAEAQLTIRLDAEEGIVRLEEQGRDHAWGIFHPRADWMRDLGRRAYELHCAQAE